MLYKCRHHKLHKCDMKYCKYFFYKREMKIFIFFHIPVPFKNDTFQTVNNSFRSSTLNFNFSLIYGLASFFLYSCRLVLKKCHKFYLIPNFLVCCTSNKKVKKRILYEQERLHGMTHVCTSKLFKSCMEIC